MLKYICIWITFMLPWVLEMSALEYSVGILLCKEKLSILLVFSCWAWTCNWTITVRWIIPVRMTPIIFVFCLRLFKIWGGGEEKNGAEQKMLSWKLYTHVCSKTTWWYQCKNTTAGIFSAFFTVFKKHSVPSQNLFLLPQAFFDRDYITTHPGDAEKITQLKELMHEQVSLCF